MRFCFVTSFYPPYHFGGDAIYIQRLARALAERGHHVTVVHDLDAYFALQVRRSRRPPESETRIPGVQVIRLKSNFGVLSPLLTQQVGKPVLQGARLEKILEEGQFDVINFHNVSLVGGPGLFRYGKGVKLYTAHEHWLVCPTHLLWKHRREPCVDTECFSCQLSYRRPPQLWRWTGLLGQELRHIDVFIALSKFSRNLHSAFGFAREMEVVPGFLERRVASADSAEESPHTRPYFLFTGRLERFKGLEDVIPLFRNYADADLLIAGDGHYEARLRRLAAGQDHVRFLGWLNGEQLARYRRHAVAVVVPSVCYETFGLSIIEAFREGTPVLARKIGPFPELVETAGGGELFTDTKELLRAMAKVQHERQYRSRLANAARAAFVSHWSTDAVLPKYMDVVQRALDRASDRRVRKLGA